MALNGEESHGRFQGRGLRLDQAPAQFSMCLVSSGDLGAPGSCITWAVCSRLRTPICLWNGPEAQGWEVGAGESTPTGTGLGSSNLLLPRGPPPVSEHASKAPGCPGTFPKSVPGLQSFLGNVAPLCPATTNPTGPAQRPHLSRRWYTWVFCLLGHIPSYQNMTVPDKREDPETGIWELLGDL